MDMKESNDWIDAKSQDVELMHYLACMETVPQTKLHVPSHSDGRSTAWRRLDQSLRGPKHSKLRGPKAAQEENSLLISYLPVPVDTQAFSL